MSRPTYGSGTGPDGWAALAPADVRLVLGALADAAEYRSNHPDDGDQALIAAYQRLVRELGGDR